jgi:putative ABC transport system substrate-binding protein
MRRAALRSLACALAAWPRLAAAQATRLPRVVMVMNNADDAVRPFVDSFRAGLREAGQIEGKTVSLEFRYGRLEPARIEALLNDAVAERPDVLVVGGLSAARRVRDLTSTIPVVVATAGDLVDAGVVSSLARPGGNITGISDLADVAAVKRLELIRGALPKAKQVALLTNPKFPGTPRIESRVAEAAPRLGFTIIRLHATDRPSLAAAIDTMAKSRPHALLVGGDPLFNSGEFIAPANAIGVPVFHYWEGMARKGALVGYEVDVQDNFRRAAGYVDKILKGVKPGDLPIHQPTRYKLVVNVTIAKALGLTLPQAFVQRADEEL